MTTRPPRDPMRLSATDIAELATCEARFVRRRLAREGLDATLAPEHLLAVEQARAGGIAEHARFHDQVTLHHNPAGSPAVASLRSAPATVENARGDESKPVVQDGRGAGSAYCFIATAIYGPSHPRTWQLRRFRERALRPSATGRWLVGRYYRTAPCMAGWLDRHPKCRGITRLALDGLCVLLYPWTKGASHEPQARSPHR